MNDRLYFAKSGAKKVPNALDTAYRHFGEQTYGNKVAIFIDGEEMFSALYRDLVNAKKQIWIAGLDIWPYLILIRDSSSKQSSTKLAGVLRWVSQENPEIQIRVLIYEPSRVQQTKIKSAVPVKEKLESIITSSGLQVRLDSTVTGTRIMEKIPIIGPSWSGLAGAAHQKMVVIDGKVGYCGGLDLSHGRWDTPDHYYGDKRKDKDKKGNPALPWHDVHARIVGPAVWDLQLNFLQRWFYSDSEDADVIKKWEREQNKLSKYRSVHGTNGRSKVQVMRTWKQAEGVKCDCTHCKYKGKEIDAFGIKQGYKWLFKNANNFLYIENQYAFQDDELTDDLINQLRKQTSLKVVIVLPIKNDLATEGDELIIGFGKIIGTISPVIPIPGSKILVFAPTALTGETVSDLKSLNKNLKKIRDASGGRAKTFCLISHQGISWSVDGSTQEATDPKVEGVSIYVHSKIAIVDDRYVMLGSANLDDWGMRVSSELNTLIDDPKIARDTRVRLWKEHLGRWRFASSKFGNDDWIDWWVKKGHVVGGRILGVEDLDLSNPADSSFGLELWDRLAYHNVYAVRDMLAHGQLSTEEWVGKIYPYAYEEMKAPPPYHGAKGGGIGGS